MNSQTQPLLSWSKLVLSRRMLVCILMGFASGLPLALTGQSMQAWLSMDGVDLATIGFLGLVAMPYTFKFLWAPLMDRFEPPWLGRRRGWLVLTQLALAAALWFMSGLSASQDTQLFAVGAVCVAFLAASQDIVIDAYRIDLFDHPEERGVAASFSIFGYRIAMMTSGGLALIWADQWQSWPQVYQLMASIMAGMAVVSLLLAPQVAAGVARAFDSAWQRELIGFGAMLLAVVAGYFLAHYGLMALGLNPDDKNKWIQLLFVMTEIAVALPLAWWAARKARFETLNRSLESYFSQSGAVAFLVLIVLYKLGDAFAGSLTTPFLIKGMGFTQTEVGLTNKLLGMWLSIFGTFLGGLLILRLRLYWSLLVFGVLQLISNAGFWYLALVGKGAWGASLVQSFDWGFVALTQPAELDWLLMTAIAGENITGSMGNVAFVALLMGLCNKQFTATHYALLSAFAAVGRIYVSPLAGVMAQSIGWPAFFVVSIAMAVPGVVMVWWMRRPIDALAAPVVTNVDD